MKEKCWTGPNLLLELRQVSQSAAGCSLTARAALTSANERVVRGVSRAADWNICKGPPAAPAELHGQHPDREQVGGAGGGAG